MNRWNHLAEHAKAPNREKRDWRRRDWLACTAEQKFRKTPSTLAFRSPVLAGWQWAAIAIATRVLRLCLQTYFWPSTGAFSCSLMSWRKYRSVTSTSRNLVWQIIWNGNDDYRWLNTRSSQDVTTFIISLERTEKYVNNSWTSFCGKYRKQ